MLSKTEVTGTSQSNFISNRQSIDTLSKTMVPFSFGFRLRTPTSLNFDDVTYLNVTLNQLSNVWDESTQGYIQTVTPLQIVSCDQSEVFDFATQQAQFKYFNRTQAQRLNLSSYWCPKTSLDSANFIGGLRYDNVFNETQLTVSYCQNQTTQGAVVCKPLETIDSIISKMQLQFFYLNAIFEKSLPFPVQSYIDNTFYSEGINPGSFTQYTIQLMKNFGYRQDSYFFSSNDTTDPIQFYELDQISTSTFGADTNGRLLQYRFRESMLYIEYSRSYLKLSAVLSSLGGTYSSLYLIGYGFTVLFSYNLMLSSIIRQLYYFKPRFESEKPKKKDKKKKKESEPAKSTDLKSSDVDDEKLIDQKRAYAEEAEAKKTGKSDIKLAFESVLG